MRSGYEEKRAGKMKEGKEVKEETAVYSEDSCFFPVISIYGRTASLNGQYKELSSPFYLPEILPEMRTAFRSLLRPTSQTSSAKYANPHI